MTHTNWWAGARLCLAAENGSDEPEELQRGQLGDMVHAAMQRPPAERRRLFIVCENIERHMPWRKIAALYRQPDFPIFI